MAKAKGDKTATSDVKKTKREFGQVRSGAARSNNPRVSAQRAARRLRRGRMAKRRGARGGAGADAGADAQE